MTKIALTLTASLAVIGDIIALLEENGYDEAIQSDGDVFDDAMRSTAVAQSVTPETATVTAVPSATAVAPTPSPTAPGSAAPSTDVEVDSKGLPWDERIHSAKKTQKSDKS